MLPKCGHCNGAFTKVEVIEPTRSEHKLVAVCCSTCGSILGITTYSNPAVLIKAQEAKINNLTSAMAQILEELDNLKRLLNRPR